MVNSSDTEVVIGTINSASFGFLNLTTQSLGVNFSLEGDGWMSSGEYELLEKSDGCNLHYLVDVHAQNIMTLASLKQLLKDADAVVIEQLVGKKVEVTFKAKAPNDSSPFIGKKFDSLRIIKG
jgi:hypothetical protein